MSGFEFDGNTPVTTLSLRRPVPGDLVEGHSLQGTAPSAITPPAPSTIPESAAALEQALRASEDKYRTLFNSIDEGFCIIRMIFDEAGRPCDYLFLEANPAFERHTGLKMSEALHRTMRELVPDHDAHWYEIYGRIALTGIPERFEQPAEALGRHFDVYAFRMGKAEERQVAVLFNDISARKHAEQAIKAELEAMRTLGALGSRLIPETEILTLYEEVNAAARKLTGADAGTVQIFDAAASELVLISVHGFPPDAPARFGRIGAASSTSCGVALASGSRTLMDFDDDSLPDEKGDLRWHVEAGYRTAQSTPLLARSGKPIGMLSTHWHTSRRRLTERESRHLDLLARQAADLIGQRQAFAEIQAARAEAETAGRAKDHFLAVLSHELRTPLTPVLMSLDFLLQEEPGLPQSVRESLSIALRNVELEVRLIDDLLDMTRIARGKLELRRHRMDAHEALSKALELCGPDLKAKGHQVLADLRAGAHWLEGDAIRLQQVFWNLIKNACKFTAPGGEIQILSRNPQPGTLELDIIDNGIGLSPEALHCVFEPFTQANAQVTRQFGGLGLGLAISRSVTTAHRGTLTAESKGIGKGSAFTVTLPVSPF
jgi:PAS domain S-box-containing protein